eukprot:gb/GECG01016653.1/.p1 GENE.gb/GECG01016653.1/~~gb/GECG01016653.1/.p1  ORF type:complete len:104 (+),score=12.49 gb/GECG01016653.1/:1-312(+)
MNSSFSSADRQQQYGTGTMGGSVGEFLGSGENIYNWIKREEPPAQKLPMYRSKYNPTNPPVRSTFNNVTQKKAEWDDRENNQGSDPAETVSESSRTYRSCDAR